MCVIERRNVSELKQFVKQWMIPPGVWLALEKFRYADKHHRSELSDEGAALLKENEGLRGRHVGARCFIMGAGSSIKAQDIGNLEGEFVISVSNTFVHPDFPRIKPQYHVLPPLLQSHGQLHPEGKFVDWLHQMEIATGEAEMFMHLGDRKMVERNRLFKKRVVHWVEYADAWDEKFDTPINLMQVPPIWSVSELALTVSVYLGFDRIYLVGIDHDWFNGALLYFYDHAKEHAMHPDQSDLGFADSEHQMRRHAYIFRKYKYLNSIGKNIYNANADPRHYLDVFPKVDFDSLFKSPE